MFRPLLAALSLGTLLVGCGGEPQELRSPACDEGKPVLVSGEVTLDDLNMKHHVTDARLTLSTGDYQTVSEASLEQVQGFPIPFTLCADPGSLPSGTALHTSVTLGRPAGLGGISGGKDLPFTGAALEDVEIRVFTFPHYVY